MNNQENHKKIYLFMSIAMFTWAIAWTNAHIIRDIKYGLSSYNLVFLRCAISIICLMPFMRNKDIRSIFKPLNFMYIFFTGALFYIYNICFFKGTAFVAGEGAILVTTINPIVTVIIISIIQWKISFKEIAGILLGVFGGLVIMNVFTSGISNIINNEKYIYFIICALTWGIITALTSFAQKKIQPLVFIFCSYTMVLFISFPFTDLNSINVSVLDSIFYINFIIVSIGTMAIGTSIYIYSTSVIGPVKASAFIFIVPFLAAGIASIILHENISTNMIIGGLLSLLGVYIVNRC